MGRLFWKLFATLFFAQLVTAGGVGSLIWLRHVERRDRVEAPRQWIPPEYPRPDEPWRRPGPPDDPWSVSGPPDGAVSQPGPLLRWTGVAELLRESEGGRTALPLLPITVGLLASLVCATLLAAYLSRPIVGLRRAFDEVARGRFDVNLTQQMGGRRDELADLGRQFDRTSQQLKGLLAHQRRLLHDVSHELRSPLARIQLAIDLARQQPEKLPSLMDRVEREAARIDHLIEELLTLARLEAQSWIALEDNVDLIELIAEIASDARFEAQSRHCTVILDAVASVHVAGHGELLHRAIENVVRNAVRYTFEGTTVSIKVAVERNVVQIAVSDEGPGIPESALLAVFEPFVRLPNQHGTDGYGLGLAITQRIVEGHGGSIQASNRGAGGLCITVTLPRMVGET
jgi:two-component system OmpR family sensor kinase